MRAGQGLSFIWVSLFFLDEVHTAVDLGVVLLDAAEEYGHSDEVLGRTLSDRWEEAVIAKKVSAYHLSDGDLRVTT